MRKTSKCLSSRFISGGGTKPGRDLRKLQAKKTSKMPRRARNAPDKMKAAALYLSKMSLVVTPPD